MIELIKTYSKIPNVKGKNFLGNWLIDCLNLKEPQIQSMLYDFKLDLDLNDRIQRQMFIKRIYEQGTVKNLIPFLIKSHVFFDIGANIGYFSFLAAATNPKLSIYSFEPLPKNINAIKKNIELNKNKNIKLIEKCISDQNGSIEFAIPPHGECGWGRISYKELFDNEKILRPTQTLDSFCDEHAISQVDFIKMDIEGFEFHVLRGAEKLLKQKNAPHLCIEMNDHCFKDMGIDIKEIFSFLKDKNYKLYYIDKHHSLRPTDKPVDNNSSWNYFALKEK